MAADSNPTNNVIGLALALIPIAESLIEKIAGAVQRAKQQGELTPEQEAQYEAHKLKLTSGDAWKIEPPPA